MVALLLAPGLLVVGTALLLFGADWFVDGAGELARALGLSAFFQPGAQGLTGISPREK